MGLNGESVMSGKFKARGLNVQGGPKTRKAMNGLKAGQKVNLDNRQKKLWNKHFARNGYEFKFCTYRRQKATVYTVKPKDKRAPAGHRQAKRKYVMFHKDYDNKVMERIK